VPDLREALRACLRQRGRGSLRRSLEDALQLARLREWCRRALADSHLVTVAALLTDELRATPADLEALGLAVDVLEAFPAWRRGSRRGFRPEPLGLTPARVGAEHPISTLRLQFSGESWMVPLALLLLRELPRCMDESTNFVVSVEPGANLERLRGLLQRLDGRRAARCRIVELAAATLFAQDAARAARTRDGAAVLLVPRTFRVGEARARDAVAESAAVSLGLRVVRSRAYWEGGNILNDDASCFVGADTIAVNRARLGLTGSEVMTLLGADLGVEIVTLGNAAAVRFDRDSGALVESGQDSFHIDLDVALLGRVGRRSRPTALIADPARGLELVHHVLRRRSLFEGQFLPAKAVRAHVVAEYQADARARFDRLVDYSATLERCGYQVIGVPDLRIRQRANLFGLVNLSFGYCNVLPGPWRGRPGVYYLPFGIAELDRAAEARYRRAGCEPVRVSRNARIANELRRLSGGLHCACGSL